MRDATRAARRYPGVAAISGLGTVALVLGLLSVVGYAPSPVTAAQSQYAPTNTAKPTISDTTPVSGQTLTASPGTWSGDQPLAFAYQWLRCNPGGQQCVQIPGATQQTYVVAAADVGNTLRVEVRATNASGAGTAQSDASDRVAAGPPPTGAVPVTAVAPPNRLLIERVQFDPNPIRSRTAPITVRVRVLEVSSGRPVSGALVFLRSTPVMTTTPPERPTGSDGWVTFTVTPERDFRLVFRPGYNIQFFVRARKPGDNLLAGVSIRRLVQAAIAPAR